MKRRYAFRPLDEKEVLPAPKSVPGPPANRDIFVNFRKATSLLRLTLLCRVLSTRLYSLENGLTVLVQSVFCGACRLQSAYLIELELRDDDFGGCDGDGD